MDRVDLADFKGVLVGYQSDNVLAVYQYVLDGYDSDTKRNLSN